MKQELRKKLLEVKQQYLDKNSERLEQIKPEWNRIQAIVPNIDNLQPYLEFCDTQYLKNLWWYGRVTVSSAPLSGEVGRRIHYLVRDASNGYILGIVGLASDLTIPIRDKFLGWTHENKWAHKRINYSMNVQHCISTPELSKYLIGKLCALSTKSEEVQSHFKNKYGHNLAMMTVTSLYGKSSLYNRLNGFIYLGTTKGYSSVLIPLKVKEQMREDFKKTKGKHAEIYYNEDGSVREKYGVVKGYQKLSKYADVKSIENVRGVYIIPLAENYKEFLKEEADELILTKYEAFGTIVKGWKKRWFLPRLQRLNGTVFHTA